ncbi:MAG: adenosine deaminase [Candidatus Roizmanbacteria bacterium]|nr:adenosine deaminase [Candidatus Roizmanbacteria bacterium]
MARKQRALVELHAHLGTSINPAVLWSIAHDQGIRLPTKDYKEFNDLVVLSTRRKLTVPEYLETVYHPILDQLSSGTHPVEKAVHETLGGAYRSSSITIHELRLNPMRHNSGGQQDLDHVIMAALRGMERALLEYPHMQAGLIFCMAREFPLSKNKIIAQKAMKYHKRGVVGIDFSGVSQGDFKLKEYADIVNECRSTGLGITVHTGEAYEIDTNDMWDALEFIKPDRIGHGILAYKDEKLMKEIAARGIVLELCPIINLVTKAVKDITELKAIFKAFKKHTIRFTINTDWPETVEGAHLNEQIDFLIDNNILTEQDVDTAIEVAQSATFTKGAGIEAYL